MAKKYIEIVLKDELEQTKMKVCAIKNSNTLKYIDNNIVSIINIDNDEISISRENNEYQLILNFKEKIKTTGTYLLKSNNTLFDLEIITDEMKIDDNSIYLKYQINEETHEISIKEIIE